MFVLDGIFVIVSDKSDLDSKLKACSARLDKFLITN